MDYPEHRISVMLRIPDVLFISKIHLHDKRFCKITLCDCFLKKEVFSKGHGYVIWETSISSKEVKLKSSRHLANILHFVMMIIQNLRYDPSYAGICHVHNMGNCWRIDIWLHRHLLVCRRYYLTFITATLKK